MVATRFQNKPFHGGRLMLGVYLVRTAKVGHRLSGTLADECQGWKGLSVTRAFVFLPILLTTLLLPIRRP